MIRRTRQVLIHDGMEQITVLCARNDRSEWTTEEEQLPADEEVVKLRSVLRAQRNAGED